MIILVRPAETVPVSRTQRRGIRLQISFLALSAPQKQIGSSGNSCKNLKVFCVFAEKSRTSGARNNKAQFPALIPRLEEMQGYCCLAATGMLA
ncbi:hypothetical protein [Rhizobium sp. LC145]|uniref:hypothetical protein n=1 Tax=Rhizobium sp. LC145 TaxID=1120688 RepID=UPI0010CA0FDA|nr:hypothetical protein [Rhizobium sp. LC145]TKT46778.1 hypothetical protein FDR95_20760 [Rhizobiaceae bacterium LC148]